MNPGAGIGEDGKMLAPSAFEVSLQGAANYKDGSITTDILDAKGQLPPTTVWVEK